MEEPTYLEFKDEFGKDILIENQNTELYIGVGEEGGYLNEEHFKLLKKWIANQELNTY